MRGQSIKHEGVIRIRGMRQLDLDRLFLGLRGCLWARHGRVCVLLGATAKWLPRPGFGPSQRDFPAEERVYRRRTEESLRVARACVALGRAISCKREPSILVSGEQLAGAKEERHMDGIPKAKAKRPYGRWRRRRRRGLQGRVARISAAT